MHEIVVVGAGLCGSLIAAQLKSRCKVTVIEQGTRIRPLMGEVQCDVAGINSTINRAVGLGGTTAYWHNALIELDETSLRASGCTPGDLAVYHRAAWELFLSPDERAESERVRDANEAARNGAGYEAARMVVPYQRANVWELARRRFPGIAPTVIHGHATRIVGRTGHGRPAVEVQSAGGVVLVEADHVVVAAGGLGTPAILGPSIQGEQWFASGYHDHPMAYVAKVRLRSGSDLKRIACRSTSSLSIRTGFTYEHHGLRAVFYLRPALGLGLKSISGEARYILSDLRNNPFSPKKVLQLLTNPEAIREGLLFKSKAGYSGDFFSVLMLGEQEHRATRGLRGAPDAPPRLNWEVSASESAAYAGCFEQLLEDLGGDIVAVNAIPSAGWEYRTAAHHSGTARDFTAPEPTTTEAMHQVIGLPGVSVCDASILRRGGVANSGLTLAALSMRWAERIAAGAEGR